ncbi:MAG: hypothetical protein WD407_05585 [Rhodospirillales bacterium]
MTAKNRYLAPGTGAADPDEDEAADARGNPTPEQRAEFIVRELEEFIRKHRTVAGMSFAEWRDMAKKEIANALIEAEKDYHEHDTIIRRLLITVAAVMVTIGFWGTAMAFDKAHYLVVGLICTIAGLWLFSIVLDWRLRRYFKVKAGVKRRKSLLNIASLTRRIKRLEKELEDEAKELEKTVEAFAKIKREKSPERVAMEAQVQEQIRALRKKLGAD